jgi:hypothetical protein
MSPDPPNAARTDELLQMVDQMAIDFMTCHDFLASSAHRLAQPLREAESRGVLLQRVVCWPVSWDVVVVVVDMKWFMFFGCERVLGPGLTVAYGEECEKRLAEACDKSVVTTWDSGGGRTSRGGFVPTSARFVPARARFVPARARFVPARARFVTLRFCDLCGKAKAR